MKGQKFRKVEGEEGTSSGGTMLCLLWSERWQWTLEVLKDLFVGLERRLGNKQVELSVLAVLEPLHVESNSKHSRHLSPTISNSYHLYTLVSTLLHAVCEAWDRDIFLVITGGVNVRNDYWLFFLLCDSLQALHSYRVVGMQLAVEEMRSLVWALLRNAAWEVAFRLWTQTLGVVCSALVSSYLQRRISWSEPALL